MQIEITKTEIKTLDLESLTPEAVAAIHATGYRIEHVDGEGKGDVAGFCEICGMPLFESDDFNTDAEGVMWHVACDDGTGE